MNLPVRLEDGHAGEPAGAERVVSVDGAWDAPGLNLSHWPGHRTPPELRHDLSTGCALRFAALAPGRRAELAPGCVAIENNHYDTDGTLALFAVRHPELALPRAERMLAAAAAGDLFRYPDDHALAVDAIVSGVADPERSPWRASFAGLADRERLELATHRLLAELPAILDGAIGRYAALWKPAVAAARADVADLERATRDDIVHLDLRVVASGTRSSRPGAPPWFDPGRHALFATGDADRVLVIGKAGAGATYRLLLSTLSWFDLVTRAALPRPDLAALCARLNELEDTGEADPVRWRAQPSDSPSPELWFGAPDHDFFDEHAPVLAPSRLAPAVVRRAVIEALRTAVAGSL